MGTRSLTHVMHQGKPLVTIYRQFDGYPEGMGKELADFLTPIRLVNGLPVGKENKSVANGIDCLAAQLIAHLKTEPGDIYLCHPNSSNCGEEYTYFIKDDKGTIHLSVYETNDNGKISEEPLFSGAPSEYAAFLKRLIKKAGA